MHKSLLTKIYNSPLDPGNLQLSKAFTILQETQRDEKFHFHHTESDKPNRLFEYGCDAVNKRFDEEFGEVVGLS